MGGEEREEVTLKPCKHWAEALGCLVESSQQPGEVATFLSVYR